MIIMYSSVLDASILVIERRVDYLLFESLELASAEFTGGMANRFLEECGYELITEL